MSYMFRSLYLILNLGGFPISGYQPAKGIQGLKYTRAPVEYLVSQAKLMEKNEILPSIKFQITSEGINYVDITNKKIKSETVTYNASTISYCAQDVKYPRVFSVIVVTEDVNTDSSLFKCHSFLCESSNQAKNITCALSVALQYCGEKMKGLKKKVVVELCPTKEQSYTNEESTIEMDA